MRYVSSEGVTHHLRSILPFFDLIVGTIEEFGIAGGKEDLIETLREVREVTKATLVVKRGVLGCSVFEDAIPDSLDKAPTFGGVQVEVLNVLGAGDAFLSGFLSGWLRGGGLRGVRGARQWLRGTCRFPPRLRACDADSRRARLFFEQVRQRIPKRMRRPDRDSMLAHLHRVTVPRPRWEELYIFAFDHRSQFAELARQGCELRRAGFRCSSNC